MNRIAAILDTGYESYPHLIATGHYAWYSTHAARELQPRAGENMRTLLAGERPDDCLNPSFLHRHPLRTPDTFN